MCAIPSENLKLARLMPLRFLSPTALFSYRRVRQGISNHGMEPLSVSVFVMTELILITEFVSLFTLTVASESYSTFLGRLFGDLIRLRVQSRPVGGT